MCSHLDTVMPDNEEKVLLHQDFWRHRRSCVRCSGRVKPSSYAWKEAVCPLEHLVNRHVKEQPLDEDIAARPVKKPSPRKRKFEEIDEDIEAQYIAEGKVKVTYEIDDDFDAAEAGKTGKTRTIWIKDFSKIEFRVEKVIKMEEDEGIFEEIIISKVVTTIESRVESMIVAAEI